MAWTASVFTAAVLTVAGPWKSSGAQCPTLSSGNCFVDCTSSVYRIACEGIRGAELSSDLSVYYTSSQLVELSVWNPQSMTRFGAAITRPVQDQMLRLDLDNMVELEYFPELHFQTKLERLAILNSPRLNDMPLELLPPQIKNVRLFRTGINEFYNDFDETATVPGLQALTVDQHQITYIQQDYFTAFPNLKTLYIRDCNISLDELTETTFRTRNPITELRITNNNFGGMPKDQRNEVFHRIVTSIPVANSAVIDLSGNGLLMDGDAVVELVRFGEAKSLNLKGNHFAEYSSLAGTFLHFDNLILLDLTDTSVEKVSGIFSGLPNLQELRIGTNGFRELLLQNIFAGFQSKSLRVLDLSNNQLWFLPFGLQPFAGQLARLTLSGNQIDVPTMFSDNSLTNFSIFTKLQFIDLTDNGLVNFNGDYLSSLVKLSQANIGCNKYQRITKGFFTHLPKSLRILNLTLCVDSPKQTPQFDPDAFSTLPPITRLILQHGSLRNDFFSIFENASVDNLDEVDLSYNSISFLPESEAPFKKLHKLKTLKLRFNRLQSLGANRLAQLTFLKELDLSRNRILTIGPLDFAGLSSLKVLTLAGNGITNVDAQAFVPVPNLEALYFGENEFTDLTSVFPRESAVGSKLVHLGLQELAMDCIDPSLISQMPNLKWMYINSSQGVNVDFGSFRAFPENLAKHPFKLFAFRVPTLPDLGCDNYGTWEQAFNSSAKFVFRDQTNRVRQHLVINFMPCHMDLPRRLKSTMSNFLC